MMDALSVYSKWSSDPTRGDWPTDQKMMSVHVSLSG